MREITNHSLNFSTEAVNQSIFFSHFFFDFMKLLAELIAVLVFYKLTEISRFIYTQFLSSSTHFRIRI